MEIRDRLDRQAEVTMIYRHPVIMRHLMRNLARVAGKPAVTAPEAGRRWEGATVIVCAAGPGIVPVLAEIRRLRKRVIVVAVNSACGALRHAAIEPDVVVSVESLDVGDQIPEGPEVVCALSSHPAVFDRSAWWLLSGGAHLYALGASLGVRPCEYGAAATCAAVTVALEWGAAEVILAGADLSYAVGQTAGYAPGSRWEAVTVGRGADGEVMVHSPEERHALHRSAGVPGLATNRGEAIPLLEVVEDHRMISGEPIRRHTTTEMLVQLQWLTRRAAIADGRIRNANPSGAHIPHAEPVDLRAERYAQLPTRGTWRGPDEYRAPTEEDIARVVDDWVRQSERVLQWVASLERGPLMPAAGAFLPFAPWIHVLAVPTILGMRDRRADKGLALAQRIEAPTRILESAARELAAYVAHVAPTRELAERARRVAEEDGR